MYNIEKNRKSLSFKIASQLVKVISHKPKVKYLGQEFEDGSFLLLSNHSARKAPTKIELYFKRDLRMWGAHELTEGFKEVHKYLTNTYFHEKKHWPKFWAKTLGTLAAPFFFSFYRGLRIIPTYRDARFMNTLKMSLEYIQKGTPIVIYPEDSSKGYNEIIEHFFSGFVSLLEIALKKGHDLNVYVAYFQNKNNTFYIDNPVRYSLLKEKYEGNYDLIAEALRKRMNEIAVESSTQLKSKKKK